MKETILLYGLGWIGQQLVSIFEEQSINYIIGKARLDDYHALQKELLDMKPTSVISLIGRTHGYIGDKYIATIDYLEEDGKLRENIRDNLYGPILLANLCKYYNIHCTYFGTGCIFTYNEDHPLGNVESGFEENSCPNFFGSSYSTVKGFTDQFMSHLFEDCVLNLRIRMPISDEPNKRNFITKITTYEKICSIENSMSVLPELLPIAIDMIQKKITGTYNFTNPGTISHNKILTLYKEIVDPTFSWTNFTKDEQRKILASDRSNNALQTSKLEALYPSLHTIETSIRNILYSYKKKLIQQQQPAPELEIKTLFITGGAGFIGSNFINYFATKYPNVSIINFDALYYSGNENNILPDIRASKSYHFIEGNLQSFDLLKYIFENNEISHIIHFAAQSHVDDSFTDSLKYTNDNITGTHNLLEVNRRFNKNLVRFIHVSTDEVYGESMISVDEKKKTEHSILCPTNPYAATKAGAELIAQSYQHSFQMPIIITRGNNVYGPNQYPEKVIPKFIHQLQSNKKITIQGDGSCLRGFLHSRDTARAFELILLKGEIGEIYNIGCDEGMEYSILDLAKKIIKIIKHTDDIDQFIEYVQDRPFNDGRYYINNAKLKKLGWHISIGLNTGLKDLIS